MKAMILAAGLGTRLRPLTDDRPKALVEINGRTLLEITLSRLRTYGIRDVIINVHHFADMIVEYLKTNDNFGMRIEVSREEELAPFLLHNVDVLSTIDLDHMRQLHFETQALATLAVQDRETSRYLLFDERRQLCGRRAGHDQPPEFVRPAQQAQTWAFSGIHVISPRLLAMMIEDGAFSIITTYLRLAARGEKIVAFRADEYYWRDLGTPEGVAQAAKDLEQKVIAQ